MKRRVSVTLDSELAQWVEDKVKERKFASKSHAVSVAVQDLIRKDTVKL